MQLLEKKVRTACRFLVLDWVKKAISFSFLLTLNQLVHVNCLFFYDCFKVKRAISHAARNVWYISQQILEVEKTKFLIR